MRIASITLKNFGPWEELAVELTEPVTIIAGANEVGKSHIADAVEFVLTGGARGLPAKKASYQLTRHGTNGGEVTLVIDKGVTIRRTTDGKSAHTLTHIQELTGLPTELVPCLANVTHLLHLPPKERLALFQLMGGGQSVETQVSDLIAKHMKHVGAEGVEAIMEVAPTARKHALKLAVEARRAAKNELAALPQASGVTDPNIVNDKTGEVVDATTVDVEQCERALKRLDNEAAELRRAIGGAKLLDAPAQLQKQVEKLKTQVVKPGMTGVNWNKLAPKLKHAEKAKDDAAREVAEAEGAAKRTQALIDQLQSWDGACPVLAGMDCPKTKDDVLEYQGGAIETSKADAKLIAALKKKHHDAMEACQKIRDEQAAVQKGLETSKEVEAQIKELEAALLEHENAAKAEKELPALEARIERGRDKLSRLRVWRSAIEAVAAARDAEALINVRLSRADTLATILADDGPVAMLMATPADLGPLQAAMPLLGGREVKLMGDGNIRLGNTPLGRCSESERYRIGLALSHLVAQQTGARWLIVDGPESLEDERRGLLSGWLLKHAAEYDTIIVLMAGTAQKAEAMRQNIAGRAGVAFYELTADRQLVA